MVGIHVMAPDGSGDRAILANKGGYEATPIWSNDGKQLLVLRYSAAYEGGIYGATLPIDAPTTGVETDRPLIKAGECCTFQEWSPDDSTVLVTPIDQSFLPTQQLQWDVRTGHVTTTTWGTVSQPTWQRRAP
jgi:hypothetical protein